jgi:murein DD-endopeptidase MepM/ murein hydrolase activator NlpD
MKKMRAKDPLGGKGKVTSNYGKRKSFEAKEYKSDNKHNGIDIATKAGTRVKAIEKGTVTKSKAHKGGFGNIVEVKHANGQKSLYGHLQKSGKINKGRKVAKGGAIGKVGSSGMSTGPHLHLSISKRGKSPLVNKLKNTENPKKYIRKSKSK